MKKTRKTVRKGVLISTRLWVITLCVTIMLIGVENSFAVTVNTPMTQNLDGGGYNISNISDIVTKGPWADVRAYASINDAVTTIGSTRTTLVVPNAQTLTGNLVTPSTLSLKILNGGSIVKASTYTLTINGPFEAGLHQVFNGFSTGGVTFGTGAVKEVYPDWFATNTTPGITDMYAAIQAAINSLSLDGRVFIPGCVYALSSYPTLKSNMILSGVGKASELKLISTSEVNCFLYLPNLQNVTIEDLYANGNRHGRLAGGGDATAGSTIVVVNEDGTLFPRENNITIRNCYIAGNGFCGITLWNAHNVTVENNHVFDGKDTGINMQFGSSRFNITGNYIKEYQFGIAISTQGMTQAEYNAVGPVRQGIVSKNIISVDTVGRYGIEIDGANENIISNNQINITNGTYGIRFPGLYLNEIVGNNKVIGNNIHFTTSVAGAGIELYNLGVNYNTFENNTIISDVANAANGFTVIGSSVNVSNSVIKNMNIGIFLDSGNNSYDYILVNNVLDSRVHGIRMPSDYSNKSNVRLRDNLFINNTYPMTAGNGYTVFYEGIVPSGISYFSPYACKSDSLLIYNSAPTTGTWAQGERVWSNTPASGSTPGWICTVAGTPGTWKSMGNLY